MKVLFTPSQKDIDEIEQWLLQEDKKSGQGFYCNWNLIVSSYNEGNLAAISIDAKPVGFVTWQEDEKTATISIAEIHPKFRSKGLGRTLITALFNRFQENGICVTDLQCAPASSEPAWKKMGYQEFPQGLIYDLDGHKKLYQILVPSLKQTDKDALEIIELWNVEPHIESKVMWKWEVQSKNGTNELVDSIIHPADPDWRIRWRKGSDVYKDTKVKYFSKEKVDFNKFIILNRMPER
jgi:GNAT superfamily N-acetyltransferase